MPSSSDGRVWQLQRMDGGAPSPLRPPFRRLVEPSGNFDAPLFQEKNSATTRAHKEDAVAHASERPLWHAAKVGTLNSPAAPRHDVYTQGLKWREYVKAAREFAKPILKETVNFWRREWETATVRAFRANLAARKKIETGAGLKVLLPGAPLSVQAALARRGLKQAREAR